VLGKVTDTPELGESFTEISRSSQVGRVCENPYEAVFRDRAGGDGFDFLFQGACEKLFQFYPADGGGGFGLGKKLVGEVEGCLDMGDNMFYGRL